VIAMQARMAADSRTEQGKEPLHIILDPAKQKIDFPQKSSMMQTKRDNVG
jgi:hypothetical protein